MPFFLGFVSAFALLSGGVDMEGATSTHPYQFTTGVILTAVGVVFAVLAVFTWFND